MEIRSLLLRKCFRTDKEGAIDLAESDLEEFYSQKNEFGMSNEGVMIIFRVSFATKSSAKEPRFFLKLRKSSLKFSQSCSEAIWRVGFLRFTAVWFFEVLRNKALGLQQFHI